MKANLKSWEAIVAYARIRAARSRKRNDPIAWAYWKETEAFADHQAATSHKTLKLETIGGCIMKAEESLAQKDYMKAALWYSRAKWFVILARANGIVMNPRKTGVNLKWLQDTDKGVQNAFPRYVAAGH